MLLSVEQWALPVLNAVLLMALPMLLLLLWRRRSRRLLPAAAGAVAFLLFALVLERLTHTLLLRGRSGVWLSASPWRLALYGALMAGVFEETGRLLAMLLFPRVIGSRRDAVTYGLGHGGIESLLLGMSVLLTLLTAPLTLLGMTLPSCLLSAAERVLALCAHISLSVLVFAAVRTRKWLLYPSAVGLHALVDVPAGLYQTGVLTNIWLTEGLTAVIAAATAMIAFAVCRRLDPSGEHKKTAATWPRQDG